MSPASPQGTWGAEAERQVRGLDLDWYQYVFIVCAYEGIYIFFNVQNVDAFTCVSAQNIPDKVRKILLCFFAVFLVFLDLFIFQNTRRRRPNPTLSLTL